MFVVLKKIVLTHQYTCTFRNSRLLESMLGFLHRCCHWPVCWHCCWSCGGGGSSTLHLRTLHPCGSCVGRQQLHVWSWWCYGSCGVVFYLFSWIDCDCANVKCLYSNRCKKSHANSVSNRGKVVLGSSWVRPKLGYNWIRKWTARIAWGRAVFHAGESSSLMIWVDLAWTFGRVK